MQIRVPDFFLRSTARLLLFQTFVAWLCIRCIYIPFPWLLEHILSSFLSNLVYSAKDNLDARVGFTLPFESTFFLSLLLDEYIITSMPDLAVLLGTSPCNHRIAKPHVETGICEHELAYFCYINGDLEKRRTASFRVWEACWEDYGIEVKNAVKHHGTCHNEDKSDSMGFISCVRAKGLLGRKNEVSSELQPIVECIQRYGMEEQMQPVFRKIVERNEKKKAKEAEEAEGKTEKGRTDDQGSSLEESMA